MDRFCLPAPGLGKFVRFYVQRGMKISGPPVVHPVTARAMPLMLFAFGDSYKAFINQERLLKNSNTVTFVGPQTFRRIDLHLQGALEDFAIVFQPDGVYRLFSIPMCELIDQDYEGHAVLGGVVSQVHQRLGECESFEERVTLSMTSYCVAPCFADYDGISAAANRILLGGGA